MNTTNAQFAKTNLEFRTACAVANVAPSKRQASKWRRGWGIARVTTLTVAGLRAALAERGITMPSRARKADLIRAALMS